MNYLNQKAAVWVSVAVLAGSAVSTLILFWLVKIENSIDLTSV